MSSLARRRLAGLSALLLVSALIPVLALPAGANGNPPSVECADPLWNGEFWKLQVNDGVAGQTETNVDAGAIAFDIADGSIIWTNQSTNSVFRVVFKTGGGTFDSTETGLWATGEGDTFDLPDKLSHITFCFTAPGEEPGDADVTVTYGCTEDDLYAVEYTVSDATINWLVNGQPATVTSGQTFDPGTTVEWAALAADGFIFGDDGDDIQGSFTAEDCSEPPPPTVSVTGACDLEENVYLVTVVAGSDVVVYVDLNGDGDYLDSGEANVADGVHPVTAPVGDAVSWEAYEVPTGFVNTASASATGGANMTANWPSTPSPGNLLVAAFFSRGNTHNITTAGWTSAVEQTDPGNDDTLEIWYRIADGSEVGVTVALEEFETSGDLLWIGEYDGIAAAVLEGSASGGPVSGSASVSSGSAVLDVVHGVALAAFSQRAVNLTHDAYTNEFAELFEGTAAANAARSTFSVAFKSLALATSADSTLTMNAAGGTAMGAVVAFSGDPLDSGSVTVEDCSEPTTTTTTTTQPPPPPPPPPPATTTTSTTVAAVVAGTTITAPTTTTAVSPATLPFTGSEAGSTLALGMALAGLGGLLLAAVKREEEEETEIRN